MASFTVRVTFSVVMKSNKSVGCEHLNMAFLQDLTKSSTPMSFCPFRISMVPKMSLAFFFLLPYLILVLRRSILYFYIDLPFLSVFFHYLSFFP